VTRPALEHISGLPAFLLLQMETRIIGRLKQESDMPEDQRAEFARWMVYRMLENRIKDGKQFDSILDSSREYFAKNMIRTVLREVKEEQPK
jgi:hypothetical protein